MDNVVFGRYDSSICFGGGAGHERVVLEFKLRAPGGWPSPTVAVLIQKIPRQKSTLGALRLFFIKERWLFG